MVNGSGEGVRRILVIEDDEGLRFLIEKTLRKAGFQAEGASTGAEALARIQARPDIPLLLDQKLPDMSGKDIITALHDQGRQVPFIVMTGRGDERLAVEMMKLGASDYLIKGMELLDLLPRAIERLFRQIDTQRRLRIAEKALQESEEKHRALIAGLPDIVMRFDREGRYLFASKSLNRLTDIDPGQCLGRTQRDLGFPEPLCLFWEQALRAVFECRQPFEGEFAIEDSRKKAVFNMRLIPEFDHQGSVESILSISRDITERKWSTEALARVNECLLELGPDYSTNIQRLTALLGELLDATCTFYHRLCNEKLLAMGHWHPPPGYPLEDNAAGRICEGTIHRENEEIRLIRHLPSSPVAQTDPTVTRFNLETYVGRAVRCGSEYCGSLCAMFRTDRMVNEDERRLIGIIASAIGMEEDRKRAEEERLRLDTQLTQIQKMESIGRLAGGVAHDFNNMLSVIMGHAEIAMHQMDPAHPIYADLQEIRTAAKRSSDLTRQLLAFARKQAIAPRELDLNETVESMLKMLHRLIGEDINLGWRPGRNLWLIKMDPSQIDQVLANLSVNARDAISGVGRVTIETENVVVDREFCADHPEFVPGDFVMLAVSDTGCGMDREILSKLFEPFFTTKELGKGTGLGLATVYGIVKQNKGFIDVYSEPGQGTTFKIYLPRHTVDGKVQLEQTPVAPMPHGNETILLVEDEPSVLRMTTMMLEQLDYTVLTANSPEAAIRLTERHATRIHLLLTDVIMPEMNGRDLARKLVALHPHLKFLFMSGYTAHVIDNREALSEGFDFLQKPFTLRTLASRVRAVLDRDPKSPA